MFWGLIMEPGKRYSKTVEKSFHVSHAALDLDSASNDPVQVLLGFENRNYLICTLQKGSYIQAPLDLNFQVGDKVSFATNGPGHVHLTGYLIPEDDYDLDNSDDEAEEEEEEEVPKLVDTKKRKASEQNNKGEQIAKKSKTAQLLEQVNEDDTDDSDDSDVNLTDMLEDEVEEEEEDDVEVDEEDSDDDNENAEDEDDNDTSEDEEIELQKMIPKKKTETPLKQNGVTKQNTPKTNQTPGKEQGKTPKTPQGQNEKKQKGDKTPKEQKSPSTPLQTRTVKGGVVVQDLKIGSGDAVADHGKMVQVYYEGRLKSNNKMFDSATKGSGFQFRLGRGEVIKGWDVGLIGMKVGGKRRITIPPHMAYGATGSPPVIPPNSHLVFEIELRNVKQKKQDQ